MGIENNGPESAYPGPAEKTTDTGEDHGSGLEHTQSEPKQGSDDRPEDGNPPPENPDSDEGPQSDSLIDSE
ncbi:hypothetical protein [Pseudomonas capsici]|uniref:hypothetical protein n=1 Tax=Pseudomonas capsici TaxID=2810614 RepID=UPI0021F0EC83|nr:hypothetical protein [Pseudomonas capsici]MCV4343213.1 hypothetical protein [Pseudomonas capsici]